MSKKILAMLLAVMMLVGLFVTPALADGEDLVKGTPRGEGIGFADAQNHWAEGSINRWNAAGVVQGDGEGNVNPNAEITRGELAQLMVNLLGYTKKPAVNPFLDVTGSEWYADAVLKCAAAGILQGDDRGYAMGGDKITREQALVLFARAMGVKPVANPDLSQFTDDDQVSSWAAGYLAPLAEMNILTGVNTETPEAAPKNNIDRASAFTMLDKAISAYITEPGEYPVDNANGFVVVNAAAVAGSDVTVSGTAAGVVVAAGNESAVELKDVKADTVVVDAATDVALTGATNVDALAVNEAAKVDNQATVGTLETNASGVTFDGNKPSEVVTAEGVEPAKDSEGKEVTEKPTSTGGGTTTPAHQYKYKVTLPSVTGGTVTADVTETDTENTTVTLTVTPNAQTETELPYIVKAGSLKVTGPDGADVTVTDNAFSMATEGTYTVAVEFVQPIIQAELFLVNDQASFDKLGEYGYTEDPQTTLVSDLAQMQWLALGVKRAEDYKGQNITDGKLTANGEEKKKISGAAGSTTETAWPHNGGYGCTMAYVNKNTRDEDPTADRFELAGAAYKFVATFKFQGADYTFTADYTKNDESGNPVVTHKVTFAEDATNTTIVEYNLAKDEKVNLPEAPEVEGYVFQEWQDAEGNAVTGTEVTMGEADVTYTAHYVQIATITPTTRGVSTDNVPYPTYYDTFGVSMTDGVITVDQAKFVQALAKKDTDNKDAHAAICQKAGTENDNPFFGVAVEVPEGAVNFKAVDDAGEEYTGAIASANGTAGFSFYEDADSQKWAAYYVHFIRYDGAATSERDVTVTVTYTDEDGKVIDGGAQVWKCSKKNAEEKGKYTIVASYGENDTETLATGEVTYNDFIIKGERPRWAAVETEAAKKTLSKAGYELGNTPADDDLTWDFANHTVTKTIPTKAITYSVTVNTLGEDSGSVTNWTVNGKTGDETSKNMLLHGTEDGYTFDGWYYTTADGEQELTKEAEYTVSAADLPKYAVQGDDKSWSVTFTPVYTTAIKTVEAMSAEIADVGYPETEGGAWDNFPSTSGKHDPTLFGDVSFAKGENGTWKASGTVNYITGFTGFHGSDTQQQEGYYLLFMTETPAKDTLPDSFIGHSNKGGFKKAVLDTVGEGGNAKTYFSCIVWLGQEEPAEGKTSTYTFNWAGLTVGEDGTVTPVDETVKSFTLNLDLSGLTFAAKPTPENS